MVVTLCQDSWDDVGVGAGVGFGGGVVATLFNTISTAEAYYKDLKVGYKK